MEYVYILQEREFIRLNENTYKIGRTSGGPHARFKGYPKDSKLLFLQNVTDSKTIEKQIKKVFKYKYIQMTEYGLEYFRGDINDMIDDIRTIIKHERNEYSINTSDVIRFMTEFTCQCVDKNIAISTTVMYKHYRSWVEKTHRSAVDISIFADTIESILPRVSDNLWNLNINMLKVRLIEVSGQKDLFINLVDQYSKAIDRFKEYLKEHNIPLTSDHLFSVYKMWKSKSDPVFYKAYFNKYIKTTRNSEDFLQSMTNMCGQSDPSVNLTWSNQSHNP